MAGLEGRLRRLEDRRKPESERSHNPEVRARMKAYLDELSAAKREGRPLSPEAQAVAEAIERRRLRES